LFGQVVPMIQAPRCRISVEWSCS